VVRSLHHPWMNQVQVLIFSHSLLSFDLVYHVNDFIFLSLGLVLKFLLFKTLPELLFLRLILQIEVKVVLGKLRLFILILNPI